MEKEKHKLEDYRYTNEQIMMHQKLIVQIFTFSLIISVPLIGYGLQIFWGVKEADETISAYAPFIFFAPIVLFIPAIAIICTLRKAIFQLLTYSSVFHQREIPGYEIRCRKATPRTSKLRRAFDVIICTYWVLYFVCFALSLTAAISQQTENGTIALPQWGIVILAILLFLAIIFLSIFTCIYYDIASDRKWDDIILRWEKVRKQGQLGIELPIPALKLCNWLRRILFSVKI